jgi:HPt (histidine-containing phosphotransfer) domain-containing protein
MENDPHNSPGFKSNLIFKYLLLSAPIPALIWGGFSLTGSMAAIPATVVWLLAVGSKAYYDQIIRPINMEIKALTRGKTDFLPPKSVRSVYNSLKPLENKIRLIEDNISKTNKYIQLLLSKGPGYKELLNKQNDNAEYFINYHDDYSALYLYIKLQFHIEIIREMMIIKKQIFSVNLNYFADSLRSDMESAKDNLLKEEYAENHRKTGEAMEKINEDVKIIMKNLVAIQSKGISAEKSQTDENLSEIYKKEIELEQLIASLLQAFRSRYPTMLTSNPAEIERN